LDQGPLVLNLTRLTRPHSLARCPIQRSGNSMRRRRDSASYSGGWFRTAHSAS